MQADKAPATIRNPAWRRYLPSVSRSLQIVAVAIVVLITMATFRRLIELRDMTLADAHRQMARLDMVFAEQTGRAVETIDFILRGTIETVQASALQDGAIIAGGEGSALPSPDLLRRRIMGVRQVLGIDIAGADGRVLSSSRADSQPSLPAAGLAALALHAKSNELGLQISEPVRNPDGRWTALITRRINAPGGGFAGIGVAYINLLYFEDFYQSVELAENGAVVLHRRDGTVLARFPHSDKIIGTSFAELPPFKDVLSHAIAGTVEMDSPVDGSRRILAIRALRAFPLAVNVSIDERDVLTAWRRQTWVLALVALAAALVVVGLMFLLARRSRDVERLLALSHEARDVALAAHRSTLQQMEERERAETALRQAQRVEAVGQLTGGVAHDFNNLLTVVLGNIDLLQASEAAAPFAGRLATMRAAAERGAMLTGQLLAFARRQPLMPLATDVNALIVNMTSLLQSAVGSPVFIECALGPDPVTAMIDPTQIELVILNLAINARDAMKQGGTVTISTSVVELPHDPSPERPDAGFYVRVSVRDTGTGMKPEVLARAFEPFFTTKGPGAGSGLGLSQVYGVARQSGGIAQIESAVGEGTVVHVLLPQAVALAAGEALAAPRLPERPGKARVLVVDDDDDVRSTTAMLLSRMGYTVATAATADAALQRLGEMPQIDVLLSDVVMPVMSGPDLARLALVLRPDLPIIFFSGYADPETMTGAAPMRHLLRKPFRPAEMAAMIEKVLAVPVSAG